MSIGGFVPKPHTPFQWAAQLDHETTDARLAKLRNNIRDDRQFGKAIGFRYHDGKPGIVEGLLSRGDRRIGAVIEAVWRDGGRFDGWSEHFSFDRWMHAADQALADLQSDLDSGAVVLVPAQWPDVLSRAELLSRRHTKTGGHRGLDILHIATALHLPASGN